MKKIIFAVSYFLILMPLIAFAQVEEERKAEKPATKLEEFLAKKGKLIIKDFYKLGEVSGNNGSKIEFDAVVIYEPGQETERIRGLRLEVTERGRYERSDTSFLDLEEIESLSKAIAYMVDLSSKWKYINKEYTEVVFSTKDDFSIGFYKRAYKINAFSSSGYIGKASCYFSSMQDLNSVKNIADKGLKLLKEK